MIGNGGIAGIAWLGAVEACENFGEVDSYVTSGGSIGFIHETKVFECVNHASVTSQENAGGIVGEGWSIKQFEECVNYGTITAKSDLGGILGFCNGDVKKCNNHGTLCGHTSQDSMGGVVGYLQDGSVAECYNNGDIGVSCNYDGFDCGGIVGVALSGTITYCLNDGNVQGGTNVGGIAGNIQVNSLVTKCKNMGNVISKLDDRASIGGIVGLAIHNDHLEVEDKGSVISECVNGAGTKIFARRYNAGGIVGELHGGSVFDSYNLGIVYGESSVGGIVGLSDAGVISRTYCMSPQNGLADGKNGIDKTDDNGKAGAIGGEHKSVDATLRDNYWWTSCCDRALGWSTRTTVDGAFEGYSISKFGYASNFKNWDFINIWYMSGQPTLKCEPEMLMLFAEASQEHDKEGNQLTDPSGVVGGVIGGSIGGEIQGPTGGYGSSIARTICIWSVDDFKEFREKVNQGDTFEDAWVVLCTDLFLAQEDWIPIGTFGDAFYFDSVNRRSFNGIFDGRGHKITRLSVDCEEEKPAGLFGYVSGYGKIRNLYVSGSVKGGGDAVGGIVGYLDESCRLENCVFEGTVTGVGGQNSSSNGYTDTYHYTGGIVGKSYGFLNNCYHVGSVNAETGFVGGVAGRLLGVGDRMNFCFQYGGTVSGGGIKEQFYHPDDSTAGGLVGKADSTFINNSYSYCSGAKYALGYNVHESNNYKNIGHVDANWFKNETNFTNDWDISDEAGHIWRMGEEHPELWIFSEQEMPQKQPVKETVTIRFFGNGDAKDVAELSSGKGETVALPANPFARVGYVFAGWNTRPDGRGISFVDEQSFSADADLTLYAQWSPDSYQIDFVNSGIDGALYSVNVLAGKTPVYGGMAPKHNGATAGGSEEEDHWLFDGWTPVIDAVNCSVTYQAKFIEKLQEYTVSIVNGTASNNTAVAGTNLSITANAPLVGQVFDRWESQDVTVMVPSAAETIFTMPKKNVTITAIYKNASYPVTLNVEGGMIHSGDVTTYTYGEGETLPTDITRENYTFEGWFTGQNGTGNKVTAIGVEETGEKSFYAHWLPIPYDVTIVAGNGMTLKAGSGAERQQGVTGEITSVVYVASEGYYFPESYFVDDQDGLTVTRNGYQQITISGKPLANTQLELRAATAKEREETPAAEFEATGTDSGTLSNLVNGANYVVTFSVYDKESDEWVDGTTSPMEFTAKGTSQAITNLTEEMLCIVRKGGDTTLDSDKLYFTIYKGEIPDYVEAMDCTTEENNDGKILGVSEKMDYRKAGDNAWTAVTGTEITGLAPGTYELCVRAEGTQLASEIRSFEIKGNASQLFTLAGASMNLGNSLDMLFLINKADVTETDCYATIRKVNAGKDDTVKTYQFSEWYTYGSYYLLQYDKLTAMEMNDKFYVQVFHADGTPASEIYEDSVADYALRGFNELPEAEKRLSVDLLFYGAAAQKTFGYDVEHLVSDRMTDAQKAYGTVSVSGENKKEDKAYPHYAGTSLDLQSRIQFYLFFNDVPRDGYAKISFTNHNGTKVESTVAGSDYLVASSTMSVIVVDELTIPDARKLVTCEVYDKDGNLLDSVTDSIESYVFRGTTGEIDEAVLKFADSAYNYFHPTN